MYLQGRQPSCPGTRYSADLKRFLSRPNHTKVLELTKGHSSFCPEAYSYNILYSHLNVHEHIIFIDHIDQSRKNLFEVSTAKFRYLKMCWILLDTFPFTLQERQGQFICAIHQRHLGLSSKDESLGFHLVFTSRRYEYHKIFRFFFVDIFSDFSHNFFQLFLQFVSPLNFPPQEVKCCSVGLWTVGCLGQSETFDFFPLIRSSIELAVCFGSLSCCMVMSLSINLDEFLSKLPDN